MSKDELLPVVMERLKIEPQMKTPTSPKEENPFVYSQHRRNIFTQRLVKSKCVCSSQRKDITVPIYKRKSNKLIKEPTLKLLQSCKDDSSLSALLRPRDKSLIRPSNLIGGSATSAQAINDSISLCALVDNCNQLRISTDCNGNRPVPTDPVSENRWWRRSPHLLKSKEPTNVRSREGPSCSQQALNPSCDVTIDELASYFETLVHIPKKMSSMAEMMYI